jgi:hypothetical protein
LNINFLASKCGVSVITDKHKKNFIGPLPESKDHKCDKPGENKLIANDAVQNAKIECAKTGGRPGGVLARALLELPSEAQLQLPCQDSTKRIIRRAKRKFLPAEPAELKDLVYEGILNFKICDLNYIVYFSVRTLHSSFVAK